MTQRRNLGVCDLLVLELLAQDRHLAPGLLESSLNTVITWESELVGECDWCMEH